MAQTAEELLTSYIHKMGPDLGRLFKALSDEVVWLHWRWNQFSVLFGEDASRIDLMNQSAPFFFRIVHDALFETILLAIARLVASEKSTGKPNLTIKRFRDLIADESLRYKIDLLVKSAGDCAAFAVEWRNRQIAHRDLSLALRVNVEPLPTVTREKIDAALSALRQVLDKIESHYCNSGTAYTSSSPSPWGAKALLHLLGEGLQSQKENWEHLKQAAGGIK